MQIIGLSRQTSNGKPQTDLLFSPFVKVLINQLLTKYWGYGSFRPMQEDVILSVLAGMDTLALMPTGGGKSICFQVPGLAREGICIVVSPLIALMKDQVESLKARDIKAVAVVSGMSRREIDIALDNCIYGNVKFLYLSPERLKTDLLKARLQKMKVNLIAVDEAHCISQWGYDFRPSYLEVANIRKLLPGVPVLALTATATPQVGEDIQKKLLFKKSAVFQNSFERKNLSYVVMEVDDKEKKMLNVLKNTQGSAIIYVRNRKRTKDIAELLQKNGYAADYYHAGLDKTLRSSRQDSWMKGSKRVIVATNAFGMGIDKSNVRVVLHYDMPDSLEAYYQEAGRAGRDGQPAYAILLFNQKDIMSAEGRVESGFPAVAEIKNVYQALANYYQLPVGSGAGVSFDFNMNAFCTAYNLDSLNTFNCLKILEMEELLELSDNIDLPSRLHITVRHEALYEFQVKNVRYDHLIKTILRSYEGLFDDYGVINEGEIAKRSGMTMEDVKDMLRRLEGQNMVSYVPQNQSPQITFLTERLDLKNINISREHLADRKERYIRNMKAVIGYAAETTFCRQQQLLHYFGEELNHRCGSCDVCLSRNKLGLNDLEFNAVQHEIQHLLSSEKLRLHQLVSSIKATDADKVLKIVEWMIDNQRIQYDEHDLLELKMKQPA